MSTDQDLTDCCIACLTTGVETAVGFEDREPEWIAGVLIAMLGVPKEAACDLLEATVKRAAEDDAAGEGARWWRDGRFRAAFRVCSRCAERAGLEAGEEVTYLRLRSPEDERRPSDQFTPAQRLYVWRRLAVERFAKLAETRKREIAADPDLTEEERAELIAGLQGGIRTADEQMTDAEEIAADVPGGLPSGELYESIKRAIEADEAAGVDVEAAAIAEIFGPVQTAP